MIFVVNWFKRLHDNRVSRSETRLFEETINEMTGRPSVRQIKKWKREELHKALVGNNLHPFERSIAEQKLRKQDAWDAPAGRAYYVSLAALVLSIVAIAISLLKAP